MRINVLVLVFFISFLSGCKLSPPVVDFCGVYSSQSAECVPTDPEKPEYDIETTNMLGYQCLSAEDFSKVKKYVNRLIEELARCESR